MSGPRAATGRRAGAQPAAGFTIVEVLVAVLVMGLITAMVAPNLATFVPTARLDAAAKTLVGNIDYLRSEARIQGKRVKLELDLQHARWRYVMPPEEKLTTDQDVRTLEPRYEEWTALGDDVVFAGAGNPHDGIVRSRTFEMVFDENGFTSDQSVVLKLESDPKMVWTVRIQGLTGACDILRDEEGNEQLPAEIGEGAF